MTRLLPFAVALAVGLLILATLTGCATPAAESVAAEPEMQPRLIRDGKTGTVFVCLSDPAEMQAAPQWRSKCGVVAGWRDCIETETQMQCAGPAGGGRPARFD